MQGLGLYTLEELKFSPSGLLYTRGPSQYKIPAVCDLPLRFNVYLLPDSHEPRAIYSSKVGLDGRVEIPAVLWQPRDSCEMPLLVLLFRPLENPPSSWAAPSSSPSRTRWRRPARSPDCWARFPWTPPPLQRGSAWPVPRPSRRW